MCHKYSPKFARGPKKPVGAGLANWLTKRHRNFLRYCNSNIKYNVSRGLKFPQRLRQPLGKAKRICQSNHMHRTLDVLLKSNPERVKIAPREYTRRMSRAREDLGSDFYFRARPTKALDALDMSPLKPYLCGPKVPPLQ